jgi:hypothetical protein
MEELFPASINGSFPQDRPVVKCQIITFITDEMEPHVWKIKVATEETHAV